MAFSVTNFVLSKNYVEETADALGAVKGAPCTILSTEEVDEGIKVVFKWTGNSGAVETSEIVIPKGVDGETPDMSDYATKQYLENALSGVTTPTMTFATDEQIKNLFK